MIEKYPPTRLGMERALMDGGLPLFEEMKPIFLVGELVDGLCEGDPSKILEEAGPGKVRIFCGALPKQFQRGHSEPWWKRLWRRFMAIFRSS